MMLNDDDGATGTVYLEPQGFSEGRKIGRQFSANDSGILDLHGSRNGSRIGLSIPNDCYRGFDSDQENPPPTPRALYPALHRMNGHAPLHTQFSYPMCGPASKPMRDRMKADEEMSLPNRNKDDHNLYTSIDEASLVLSSETSSKAGDGVPLVCTYRHLGSRQVSVDSDRAKGRQNIIYEPPKEELSRRAQGAGKTKPVSGKCCLSVFCNLLAVAAIVLAVVQIARTPSSDKCEQLSSDYGGLKAENEGLKQSMIEFENKLSAMLSEKLNELNNSHISIGSNDDNIGLLLFRLLMNDSSLVQSLLNSFNGKVDQVKAEINSKIASTQQEMSQLVLQKDDQLRMDLSGIMPFNMSACEYKHDSLGIAASYAVYSTQDYDLNSKFVLRVFCTTEGGTEALLEYDPERPNVYKCTCRGQSKEATSRYCSIHYWTCPYI